MVHNNKEVLAYRNEKKVQSMYDKYLINLEIQLITSKIPPKSKILDAGCGEGEGTLVYSKIPKTVIHAVDFSNTRLRLAKKKLKGIKNVIFKQADFLNNYNLDNDYDIIISQRFLINLMKWNLQKKVLRDLLKMLRSGGKIILLEGCIDGVRELNKFRSLFGLEPIPVKWHNLFFDNKKLVKFMSNSGAKLIDEDGLGEYFLLTRGVRPVFDNKLNWDTKFNQMSAGLRLKNLMKLKSRFSRLKLWVFEK